MNIFTAVPPAPRPPVRPAKKDHWMSRPIQALKDQYVQAWLYFLLIVSIVVAWWFPIRVLYQRYRYTPIVSQIQRDAESFVALTYTGISDRTNEVSPAQFDEHLKALHDHGYVPIGLTDVQGLLYQGKPLPRRAVLVTFEQARKSSYFETRDILRRRRWKAVMFLWTKPISDEEPSSLRWPYVKDMAYSANWEIGAESDNGFVQVPSDAKGHKGNFMTTPMWIAEGQRYETAAEYERRLSADLKANFDLIVKEIGRKPIAYAFPYGDFGQYDSRAVLTRRLNLDLVGQRYALGFVSGNMALNTRFGDPRRLNRLLVQPSWSGDELVAKLEHTWPIVTGFENVAVLGNETAWITDWGRSAFGTNGILLRSTPTTTGAKMWLAGSNLCRDFQTRLRFMPIEGQFGVFLRATPDEESYLYIGMEAGNAWLRQKFPGLEPFTLASARAAVRPNEANTLDVFLRGRQCFVRLNGVTIFTEGAELRGPPRPGMLGLNLWDPRPGVARARVMDFNLRNRIDNLAEWNSSLNGEPWLAKWINLNAYRVTQLGPPWMDVTSHGVIPVLAWDGDVVHRLAQVYDMQVTPRLYVHDERGLDLLQPDKVASQVQELQASGMYVNLAELDPAASTRAIPWLKTVTAAFAAKGLSLFVRFPSAMEQPATLASVMAVIPAAHAVVGGTALPALPQGNESNRMVAVENVPSPPSDLSLSLYYQITGTAMTNAKPSFELQTELLRQEGHAAFAGGDYNKALELWSQWHQLDPNSDEALMLMGDVCRRNDDPEKALRYYTESLAVNPGQISLAVRRAQLLESMGRKDEAQESLNLYARVFPDNSELALAQADWMNLRGQRPEARALVERVLKSDAENLKARVMLQNLLDAPVARYDNMRQLLAIGSEPVMQYAFGEVILNQELLSFPEASVLMPFIGKTAETSPDPQVRQIYQRLLPLREIIVEDFADGRISTNWISSGDNLPNREGRYRLRTTRAQQEAFLRLQGSDAMRNGFIEVTLDEARGHFWLYARRGPSSMVRFGFDQSGYLHLQVWRNGAAVQYDSKPWLRPPGAVRMRLELRGDGAIGYINGKPAFVTPLKIPADLGQGWWGAAPYAPQLGMANVIIRRIEAGPLPVRMVLMTGTTAAMSGDGAIDAVKNDALNLSVLAPVWFVQNSDGTLPTRIVGDPALVRMFTQYYRLRLLPVIQLFMDSDIPAEWLIRVARENRLDGFILSMSHMPDNEWMDRMRKELEVSPLEVIAMSTDDKTGVTSLREISLGYGIMPAREKTWTTRIRTVSGNESLRIKTRDEETQDGPLLWSIDTTATPGTATNETVNAAAAETQK